MPVKFTFDLIVYFEYSIVVLEYVILIRPKSNHLTLSKVDVDFLCRMHIVCCNFSVQDFTKFRVCLGGGYYTFCKTNT